MKPKTFCGKRKCFLHFLVASFFQFYLYGLENNYIFNNLMCIVMDFSETVFNKVNNSHLGSKQGTG